MNASAVPDTNSPPTTAPLALWRVAEAFMHLLYNLFGAPADVARQHALTAKAHKLMCSWLACAEALLRRLILIEASAYPKPNTRPPQTTRARQRTRRENTGDPETWRVSFRCFSSSPIHGGSPEQSEGRGEVAATRAPSDRFAITSPARGGEKRFHPSWPIAARYEALRRAFNDPAPYAHRLARRLHAAPQRAHTLLRAPREAAHRIDRFDAVNHRADIAVRGFNST